MEFGYLERERIYIQLSTIYAPDHLKTWIPVQLEDYNYTTRGASARDKEVYKYTLLFKYRRA
jgi:hypothetical protein